MTIKSSELVTVAEAKQSFTSLCSLRLSLLLASLPFGMLLFGLNFPRKNGQAVKENI